MRITCERPDEIETKSFEIIGEELNQREIVLKKEQEPVTKRVIHTTADFEYTETLTFSEAGGAGGKRPDLTGSGYRDGHQYGVSGNQ